MRKSLLLPGWVILCCLIQLTLSAQAPLSFNYQLLVTDGLGHPVHDQEVAIKVSIWQDNTVAYEEVFTSVPAVFGQVSLRVGMGTPSVGTFAAIDWSTGRFTLESAVDINGGIDYTLKRTSPLNSLPYTLHTRATEGVLAKTADERDQLDNPRQGQVIFCINCGSEGQFQIYNGTMWTDALGQAGNGPIVIQSLGVFIKDVSELGSSPEEETLPLGLTVTPANASTATVEWTSDNESVASVDQTGVVSVHATGEATITATARDGGGASGSIMLQFEDQRPGSATLTDLYIVGDTACLVEEQRFFTALLLPFSEVDTLTTWRSLDETLATIDQKGTLQALDSGIVQIVAVSGQDTSLQDTFDLVIYPKAEIKDMVYPIVTIDGFDSENTVTLQRGPEAKLPTATAEDDRDGPVPVTIRLDETFNPSPFDSMTLAQYRVIYSTVDAAGNASSDSILVEVVDTLAPLITFADSLSNGDTLFSENTSTLNLPAATAVDDNGDPITVQMMPGDFVSTKAGTFSVFYQATDPQGNQRLDSVIVVNADRIAPVITLSDGSQDGDTLLIPQGLFYELPVGTATDDDGRVVDVLFENNGFDSLTMGYYPLQFQAEDAAGNLSRIEVMAYVRDNVAPVINNKIALEVTSSGFAIGDSDTIGIVEASDNVGIASYEMFWLPIEENWEGTMRIDDQGRIIVAAPNGNAFEASFYYRIIVRDSVGLKDSVDMRFIYSQGRIRDVRAKQYLFADWQQMGQPYDDPQPYSYELKEETAVGDTALFLYVNSNAFTRLKHIEFAAGSPNVGQHDFQLVQDGDFFYLILQNALDQTRQANYDFQLNVITQNRLDTNLLNSIPWNIQIAVQDLRQLTPSLDTLFPQNIYTEPITVGDLLNPLGNTVESVACPLRPAHEVLADLGGALDILIKDLPVIPEKTFDQYGKELINKLPIYFWISKDGRKTRINLKVPVKGKKLRIEYVIDPVRNGCYWAALLDRLKAKDVDSKLEFLDQKTAGGIVINTIPIKGTDFKCVEIPCLDLNAGGHFVVNGKPFPSNTNGILAEALVSPSVFAVVSPLSNGYNDPALTVTYGLKADFKSAFDQEMIQRLANASAVAQASISLARQGVFAAEKQLENALGHLGLQQINLQVLDREIARFTGPVTRLTGWVSVWNSEALRIGGLIAEILGTDEICTPGICVVPCLYPGWCSRSCGFFSCSYPCLRSCGCEVRAPSICVPNPIAEAQAALMSRGPLRNAQNRLASATAALDRAQRRLAEVSSPRAALLAILATAEDAVTLADSELALAQQNLNTIIENSGPLGDVANFLLDNTLNKSVATTKAVFTTTIGSAESGTYTGDLSLTISILGSSPQTLTIPQFKITGNQIENSMQAAYDAILNAVD